MGEVAPRGRWKPRWRAGSAGTAALGEPRSGTLRVRGGSASYGAVVEPICHPYGHPLFRGEEGAPALFGDSSEPKGGTIVATPFPTKTFLPSNLCDDPLRTACSRSAKSETLSPG